MAEQIVSEDTTSVIMNPDGTYSAVPYAATGDSGQVYLSLNDLGIQNDGEDMVLIAADDNLDMATLENLIASGAVTTVTGEGSTEFVQLGDQTLVDGTQIIEVSPEQMQFYDPTTKTYYGAPGIVSSSGGILTVAGAQPGGITYKCPSCPAMYSNANAFTKHMREKHFVKVYTCRQCEEFFETLSQLFLHARRCHVDPKKPKRNPANYKFHCDQCNYMTNNGGTMEHHKRAHTGEKPFVCDVCNKRFAQKANMKTHRNRHIYRDKIFRCDTCNKAFSSYDIYLAHLRTREHELREHFAMMASSQLSLECLGCSLTFDSIYNLNKHTRSCRIVRTLQTKFRCLPCNAYVSDVASLKAHVKAHEGSQIISCPVCGERGFPGFNQLNHHITRAHALKVNRRHVCRYCESTFEMKKDLDTHIRSMHAEERNARQSRGAVGRLKCRYSQCEFTTNSIMLLDRHHDQHRRQEEDGEDSVSLPPARYVSSTKRRRLRGSKFDSLYGEEEDEEGGEFAEGEEDFEVEEEVDDDLAPVEDGTNVTRRTITLIKAAPHKIVEGQGEQIGGGDEDALRPLTERLPPAAMGNSAPALAATRRSTVTPNRHLSVAPSSRRITRARRLPAWYKDYDTDYIGVGEESPTVEATIKSRLPAGIELTDPTAAGGEDGVPTEEWNVVVYDDEEPIERSDDKEEGEVAA
ncbi:Zinc finger and SCAN domain-containing protein 2 [Taenia crassiceps]|uniref:Zinc finger and SCAN domain-containing protein 2 n=1 Tax=Taenia crassiceps TaxID=6207 RepID=A0ABR4Q5X1_9CEST